MLLVRSLTGRTPQCVLSSPSSLRNRIDFSRVFEAGASSSSASLAPSLRFFASVTNSTKATTTVDQQLTGLDLERKKKWVRRATRHYHLIEEYKLKTAQKAKLAPKPQTDMESWELLLHRWQPEQETSLDEIYQKVGLDWNDPAMAIDSRYDPIELAKPLRLERGRTRTLYFNNNRTMNAITLEQVRSLETNVSKWEHWDIRGLLWLSKHKKVFSAGADIRKLATYSESEWEEYFRLQARFHYFLSHSRLPLIPVPDGMALGFGAAIVLNSPVPFVTNKTLVGAPAVAFGFIPDCGLSFRFSRLGSLGRFLALTTYQLTGDDLMALDLVKFYGSSGHSKGLGVVLSTAYTNKPERFLYSVLSCATTPEDPPIQRFLEIIERCFSHNTVEGIIEALEKEESSWAKEQLATMKEMCPLSQKVTLAMLQKAESLSLKECFLNEYRLAIKFRTLPEFVKGVKARITNELSSPNWRSLSEISNAEVESLFTPTPGDEKILEGVRISQRRPPIRDMIDPLFDLEETLNSTFVERQGQPIPLPAREIIAKFLPEGAELPSVDSRIDKELNETKYMAASSDEPTATTATTAEPSANKRSKRADPNNKAQVMRARRRLVSKLAGINNTENPVPLAWDDRF